MPLMHKNAKTNRYRQKLELIESRFPLEVPLFDAKSGERLPQTVVLNRTPGYVWCGWGYYCYKTSCELEFYIRDPNEGSDTDFTQCLDTRSDPQDYEIPLDVVYKIAQGPVKPIMWLLVMNHAIPRFWQHPLCEPYLMGLIASYLIF